MLRHTLATLAYRAGKALREAPPEFASFRSAPGVRTPGEILAHMGDLLDWALSIAQGRQQWRDAALQEWETDVQRFFAALEALDQHLAGQDAPAGMAEKLFQGPIADALTHTGQIALLRRMAGCPVRGENYFVAEISVGRCGLRQATPRKEFD